MNKRKIDTRTVLERINDLEQFTDWVYETNKLLGVDLLKRFHKTEDYVYTTILELEDRIEKLEKRKIKTEGT